MIGRRIGRRAPESEEKESGEMAEKKIRPRRVSEEEQARKERGKVCRFFLFRLDTLYLSFYYSFFRQYRRKTGLIPLPVFSPPTRISSTVGWSCAESWGGAFAVQARYGGGQQLERREDEATTQEACPFSERHSRC